LAISALAKFSLCVLELMLRNNIQTVCVVGPTDRLSIDSTSHAFANIFNTVMLPVEPSQARQVVDDLPLRFVHFATADCYIIHKQ
jgi:hypothetical protein